MADEDHNPQPERDPAGPLTAVNLQPGPTMKVPPLPPMLAVGDMMPKFLETMVAPGDMPFVNALFGRIWVLFIYERGVYPRTQVLLQALRDLHARLKGMDVSLLAVSNDHWESHRQTAGRLGIPFPLLSDPTGITLTKTGFGKVAQSTANNFAGVTLVVNTLFHIASVTLEPDAAAHAASVMAGVERSLRVLPKSEPVFMHAPVLLVPNVFEPELCRYLMHHYDVFGNGDSGFMVTSAEGKTVGQYDYGRKIRRDHFIEDAEVKKAIDWRIGYRLRPEIRKAFNFDASRREDLKIIGYDSKAGGYFRPHRDNTSPSTAHRRWALTINLNSEECVGGDLRFPEFGPLLYKPRSGDAVVFGCSLLHEVTDVTAGRRLAMTTFLYGEKELATQVPLDLSQPGNNDKGTTNRQVL